MKELGIKKKISLGFVLIGTILLLSSLIAIYELISMRRSVSTVISDNISSINASRLLLEITDEYNFILLKGIGEDTTASVPDLATDMRFVTHLNNVKSIYANDYERKMADSVLYAFTAYMHVMNKAPEVWEGPYQGRRYWYFNNLYPVYMKLRKYIQSLTLISQESLAVNSQNLSDSFYRSLMPGVVAVAIGIVLVFLFNYFINFYFIAPLLAITKGIEKYIQFKKSYNVEIESDDELDQLNESVKELIDSNKNLSKHLDQ